MEKRAGGRGQSFLSWFSLKKELTFPMKESIYTIPVSEILEPRQGCPLCILRDTLEKRAVEYIMGAAMMEPDVRQETNRQGFARPITVRCCPSATGFPWP